MTSTPKIKKTVAAALAAAFVTAGVITWSAPAEARFHGGGFHGGGMGSGFHGGGFHSGLGGFAGRPFAHPGFANHRAFFAGNHFHNRNFFFRHRHFLGPTFALAAYGAPYYYNNYYDNDDCYVVRKRHINRWGYVVSRRVLVCY